MVYDWLRGSGSQGEFDSHIFACLIAIGLGDPARPLTEALGLAPDALSELISVYFPHARKLLEDLPADASAGEMALEESDLIELLLANSSSLRPREEGWLARIIARRSLGENHLWQDLGLPARNDLSRLMERHFQPLKRKNAGDMKWKKFFYRQMCEAEGMSICKSPNCADCDDYRVCFGPEEGMPLIFQAKGSDFAA